MNLNLPIFAFGQVNLPLGLLLIMLMANLFHLLIKLRSDLGILLTSNLSWDHHYNFILRKVYKIFGLIHQTFSINLAPVKKQLYISLIRSQLLYCSQVWRPYTYIILLLERVQRRVLNNYQSSYKSCLLNFKLLPLMYVYL